MGGKGGRAPYRKGYRFEAALVRLLEGVGLDAQRMPGSGSSGGMFAGDIQFKFPEGAIRGLEATQRIEAKCRGQGFRQIYGWLRDHFAVIAKEDRQDAIITLKMKHAASIVEALMEALQQIRVLQARIAELEEEGNESGTKVAYRRRTAGNR
jgi:Holliday junction resolvase